MNDCQSFDFAAGEMLLINKPAGWTSFDVVNKIKRTIQVKVGHAGTLDPQATGLLILCTGKKTKEISRFQDMSKVYSGTITLGHTTPSYDGETPPDQSFPTDHITEESIRQKARQFIGKQEQTPPIYSAIKVGGERLYKKARRGESVAIRSRTIEIFDFDITGIDIPEIKFRVHCSKGTYIRSLAYDLGKALASGAYLSALHREQIGKYHVDEAWELEEFIKFVGKPSA